MHAHSSSVVVRLLLPPPISPNQETDGRSGPGPVRPQLADD